MGVLAVELFAIPVGIIGDGFADWAADNVGAGGDDDDAALPAKAEPVGGASGWLYGFVQGRNAAGEWYESVLFYLVFATVVQQSIETLPAWKAAYGQELDMLEEVSVAIFAFDYFARLATAHHDPEFKGKSFAPVRYVFSLYALLDVVSIAPYFWTLAFPGGVVDDYDEALRMLRLLRLLKMDKYIPSITLIDDVMRNNALVLTMTGFTAGVFWIVFSTLMWMSESANTMSMRSAGHRESSGTYAAPADRMPMTPVTSDASRGNNTPTRLPRRTPCVYRNRATPPISAPAAV